MDCGCVLLGEAGLGAPNTALLILGSWSGEGGCLTEADPKTDPILAPATPGKYRKQLYSKGQVI